jgi:hypothetical protein
MASYIELAINLYTYKVFIWGTYWELEGKHNLKTIYHIIKSPPPRNGTTVLIFYLNNSYA